jgi:hypothetical protein
MGRGAGAVTLSRIGLWGWLSVLVYPVAISEVLGVPEILVSLIAAGAVAWIFRNAATEEPEP